MVKLLHKFPEFARHSDTTRTQFASLCQREPLLCDEPVDDILGSDDEFLRQWGYHAETIEHVEMLDSIRPRPPSTTLSDLLSLLDVPARDIDGARTTFALPIAIMERTSQTDSLHAMLTRAPEDFKALCGAPWPNTRLRNGMVMLQAALRASRQAILEDLLVQK